MEGEPRVLEIVSDFASHKIRILKIVTVHQNGVNNFLNSSRKFKVV